MTIDTPNPVATNLQPYQIGLRTVLALPWFLGVLIAAGRYGAGSFLSFGLPVAILGSAVIAGASSVKLGHLKSRGVRVILAAWLAMFFASICIATPADSKTWMIVCGGFFWLLLFAVINPGTLGKLMAAPLACQGMLMLQLVGAHGWRDLVLEGEYILDTHGGRSGIQFSELCFGNDGPNTQLLEEYLGPLSPHWKGHCFISTHVRDGDERVDSRSVIYTSDLSSILKKLPNDEARRQILRCLTDSKNLLRVHQNLLLVCLDQLGFPPGYDREDWWAKHAPIFHREYDPNAAARTVWGWQDRISRAYNGNEAIRRQLRAVEYQEQGAWGGDLDLSQALDQFRRTNRFPDPMSPPPGLHRLGYQQVAWWPNPFELDP